MEHKRHSTGKYEGEERKTEEREDGREGEGGSDGRGKRNKAKISEKRTE